MLQSFDATNLALIPKEEPIRQTYSLIYDCLLILFGNITKNYKFNTQVNIESKPQILKSKIASLENVLIKLKESEINSTEKLNEAEFEKSARKAEMKLLIEKIEALNRTKELFSETLNENLENSKKIENLENEIKFLSQKIEFLKGEKTDLGEELDFEKRENKHLTLKIERLNVRKVEVSNLKESLNETLIENIVLKAKLQKEREDNEREVLGNKKETGIRVNSTFQKSRNLSPNVLKKNDLKTQNEKPRKFPNISQEKIDSKNELLSNSQITVQESKIEWVDKQSNKVSYLKIMDNSRLTEKMRKRTTSQKKLDIFRPVQRTKTPKKVTGNALPEQSPNNIPANYSIREQFKKTSASIKQLDHKVHKINPIKKVQKGSKNLKGKNSEVLNRIKLKDLKNNPFLTNLLIVKSQNNSETNSNAFFDANLSENSKFRKKGILKVFISEFFDEKRVFDANLINSPYSSTTPEQFLYVFLKRKFGLDNLVMRFANEIVDSTNKYENTSADVRVFYHVS